MAIVCYLCNKIRIHSVYQENIFNYSSRQHQTTGKHIAGISTEDWTGIWARLQQLVTTIGQKWGFHGGTKTKNKYLEFRIYLSQRKGKFSFNNSTNTKHVRAVAAEHPPDHTHNDKDNLANASLLEITGSKGSCCYADSVESSNNMRWQKCWQGSALF